MEDKTEKLLAEETPMKEESEAATDVEAVATDEQTVQTVHTKGTVGTFATIATMMTKPTVPGDTKTSVGAAAASIAASLDNATNTLGKSMKKMQDSVSETFDQTSKSAMDATEKACGTPEPSKTVITGDKTVDGTDYVSFNEAPKEIPKWKIVGGGVLVVVLFILGLTAIIPGTKLNQAITDAQDNAGRREVMTVGFIGNSYLYVNDVPRVVQSIAKGSIIQQSVINTGASLGRLLRSGNGMYELWATEEAAVNVNETAYVNLVDEDYALFDMGYCTVPQLLEGYDQYLTYKNYNGAYYNNGKNPCFVDEYYLTIINDMASEDPLYLDFVVLNDLTKLMASEDEREDSVEALMYAYAPMIRVAHAVPILVDTHAYYWEANVDENTTHFGTDVANFTSHIYAGVLEYQAALASALPEKLAPRIAPIGLAYLTIYEERPGMYEKLFASDGTHSSVYGTYLFGTILYATIYNRMPPSIGSGGVEEIFAMSREILDGNMTSYPSRDEANYLRRVANRVALNGHKPKTLWIAQVEEFEEIMGNETEYEGEGYENEDEEEDMEEEEGEEQQ